MYISLTPTREGVRGKIYRAGVKTGHHIIEQVKTTQDQIYQRDLESPLGLFKEQQRYR